MREVQSGRSVMRFHKRINLRSRLTIINPMLVGIAKFLVSNRREIGDKMFYVFVAHQEGLILGDFGKREFSRACRQYLQSNKEKVDQLRVKTYNK